MAGVFHMPIWVSIPWLDMPLKMRTASSPEAGQSCPGPIDFYATSGSMRAFLLSRVFGRRAFWEIGAGSFRQSFSLWKDDGYAFDEMLHGFGWMTGVGIRRGNLS